MSSDERTRREIGEAVNGAPCICHLLAPPPSIAGLGVYLFSHNDAPLRHNYRHYSQREKRKRDGERARFNAQAARTMARCICIECIFTHGHTPSPMDVTRGSLRPPHEIDRFFPRSLVLLCFDSGGELWFRATTSDRLLTSRAAF